ncbi:uncharacterized protein BDV17DRAFT_128757 [Aspergillus undulatus]|uniref:uncharacterized protein n=1 Tax=Aspergillus undulatus TaxID=1810928 RepID=UPI003CCD7CE3
MGQHSTFSALSASPEIGRYLASQLFAFAIVLYNIFYVTTRLYSARKHIKSVFRPSHLHATLTRPQSSSQASTRHGVRQSAIPLFVPVVPASEDHRFRHRFEHTPGRFNVIRISTSAHLTTSSSPSMLRP